MPLSAPTKSAHSGMSDALQRIQEVIRDTSTPIWLVSVPANFGNPAAGTLKADEWRSLITVYMPIALISLWGQLESGDHLKDVLDHTMLLVSAVYLSCARTMSPMRSYAYRSCITKYVSNLKQVHPDFDL